MLKDMQEILQDDLGDPEFVQMYLTESLHDGPETFYAALGNVLKARRGDMSRVAGEAALSRESLYRALSERGNPEFRTVARVLEAVGLRLTVERVA